MHARLHRAMDAAWKIHALGLRWPRLRPVLHMLAFLKHEAWRHQRIGLLAMIRDLRHGFWSESHVLYDLARHAAHEYLPDYAHISRAQYLNGTDGLLLWNKLWFDRAMRPFADHLPRLYGIVRGGSFRPVPPGDGGRSFHGGPPDRAIVDLLRTENRLVVKPIRGGEGRGVSVLSYDAGQFHRDGRPTDETALGLYAASLDEYLVQEYVEQGAFPASVFPGVTNTIRMQTMWDYTADRPFIAAACHRFGRTESVPVDNACQGGLTAGIDIERGVLGPAVTTILTSPNVAWHDVHPDTGAPISGRCIPGWEDAERLVLSAASHLSFIPYVGWDLVQSLREPGLVFLEANSFGSVQLLQVHNGLLRDPRVRAFYRVHGVI